MFDLLPFDFASRELGIISNAGSDIFLGVHFQNAQDHFLLHLLVLIGNRDCLAKGVGRFNGSRICSKMMLKTVYMEECSDA